ncbi:uncharacterized protein [Periplaneta americana]|uniref:uncharacterized protein isoform X2 n=1 Tax=Periplaneta americana TaxID=6978 RepID=UPI0037E8CD23
MESEVDPLDLHHDNTYISEENKSSSKKGNLPHLEVTGMKTECVDHSYEIKSEIKVEDSAVPTSFAFVKCEVNQQQQSSTSLVCTTQEQVSKPLAPTRRNRISE